MLPIRLQLVPVVGHVCEDIGESLGLQELGRLVLAVLCGRAAKAAVRLCRAPKDKAQHSK